MVKKGILISILTLILISLTTIQFLYEQSALTYLRNETAQIKELTLKYLLVPPKEDEKEQTSKKIENLLENWDNKENLLCTLQNHKDMAGVSQQLSRTLAYYKIENYGEALAELNQLDYAILALEHMFNFNLQSIF
jgi:hypothetical protein